MKPACGWLYTLHHYGYPPSLEDTLKGISKAAEWGFEAFEMEAIGEENLKLLYAHRHEIRTHIDSLGLVLANFVPMLPDIVSLDRARQVHALEMFELGTRLAVSLGARLVMCNSFQVPLDYIGEAPADDPIHYGKRFQVRVTPEFSWDRVWQNLVAAIGRCAEIAADHGIRLGMELRVAEAVSNTDAYLRLHETVGNPNLGVVFDTAHLHAQKEILPLSIEKLKDRIFFVHASDNDGRTNEHLALGDGTIDWAGVFQALQKHRYDGYIGLDIGDCPDLESAYLRSKRFVEDFAQG
jgi:sugar phosphate isomerase/epimerase